MMELSVVNVRSILDTKIVLERIAVVSAPNGRGKTSLAMAMRALLTGTPAPQASGVDAYTKGSLGALVRDGMPSGGAVLWTEAGRISIAWPEGQFVSNGTPPSASRCAAGFADAQIALTPMKDRPAVMVALLGASPTRADLDHCIMGELGLGQTVADQVWTRLQRDGWDATVAYCHDRVVSNKAVWKKVTGENYGSQKANSWRPSGWKPGYEQITPEKAQARVAELEQASVAAKADVLVSADRRAYLSGEAEKVGPLEARYEELCRAFNAADSRARQATIDLEMSPSPTAGPAITCPHCQKPVKVDRLDGRTVLAKAEDSPSTADLGKRQARHDGARKAVSDATVERDSTAAARTRCAAELEQAQKAKRALEAMPAAPEDAAPAVDISADLVEARSVVHMLQQVAEATAAHRFAQQSGAIHAALVPAGLRQTVLTTALEAFNAEMQTLAEVHGFPAPTVDADLQVKVGDRLYRDLSESEKFRARIVMQLVIARRDGSKAVVIDNDVDMDRGWYGRLLRLLMGSGLYALLTVRATADHAITVGKASEAMRQLVRCYYLENGSVDPLEHEAAA